MSQNPPRLKAVSRALHQIEGGRVEKSRKGQEPASTRKIKADALANSISASLSRAAPKPKHSLTPKHGQASQKPGHGASETNSSSNQSSIKQSPPPKNVMLSESEWHPSKLPPNTTRLGFNKGYEAFDIRDHHLDLIVAAGPDFCHKLQEFSCGDGDEGFGSQLSDAAVIRLAAACPNLRQVYITSALALTDAALLAFLTHCPNMHTLSITGNRKRLGQIKPSALMELRKKKTLAKHLSQLDLVDQPQTGRTLESVSKA